MKPYTDDKDRNKGKFDAKKQNKDYVSDGDKLEAKNANRTRKKKVRQNVKKELRDYLN